MVGQHSTSRRYATPALLLASLALAAPARAGEPSPSRSLLIEALFAPRPPPLAGEGLARGSVATLVEHAQPAGALPAQAGSGWRGVVSDGFLVIETLAINLVSCAIVSQATSANPPGSVPRSLYVSAHTSSAFAVATSFSYLVQRRLPGRLALPVWIATHALATTSTATQVLDSTQRWSQAVVGAGLGSAFGLLVPLLRRLRRRPGSADLLSRLILKPTHYEAGVGVKAQLQF